MPRNVKRGMPVVAGATTNRDRRRGGGTRLAVSHVIAMAKCILERIRACAVVVYVYTVLTAELITLKSDATCCCVL